MAQILETVDFEVPVSVAYNQWTQFESFPEFLGMVDEVTQTDDITNHWTVTIAVTNASSIRSSPSRSPTIALRGPPLRATLPTPA